MTDLYNLPKDILIMILKYIEQDTISKCKNDLKFLKDAFDNLPDKKQTLLLKDLLYYTEDESKVVSGVASFENPNCFCYSDEFCPECDN